MQRRYCKGTPSATELMLVLIRAQSADSYRQFSPCAISSRARTASASGSGSQLDHVGSRPLSAGSRGPSSRWRSSPASSPDYTGMIVLWRAAEAPTASSRSAVRRRSIPASRWRRIHLSRFPLREWTWRAPSSPLLEGGFEMLVSLALIAAGIASRSAREPQHFHDWPGMCLGTLAWRRHDLAVSRCCLLAS